MGNQIIPKPKSPNFSNKVMAQIKRMYLVDGENPLHISEVLEKQLKIPITQERIARIVYRKGWTTLRKEQQAKVVSENQIISVDQAKDLALQEQSEFEQSMVTQAEEMMHKGLQMAREASDPNGLLASMKATNEGSKLRHSFTRPLMEQQVSEQAPEQNVFNLFYIAPEDAPPLINPDPLGLKKKEAEAPIDV